MFEISALKEKKISELQEIASGIGIKKFTTLKKMDLAYKIIDHYAANPKVSEEKIPQKDLKEIKSEEKTTTDSSKNDNPVESKTEKPVSNHNNKNNGSKFVRKEKNHNKDIRNRYKEPDFEFDGIIESEGVLDIMQEEIIHRQLLLTNKLQ